MTDCSSIAQPDANVGAEIRVRGRVQGVGFRPAIWRFARELGLSGDVRNDADGVLIRLYGSERTIAALIARIHTDSPPLARIDAVETGPGRGGLPGQFVIAGSLTGGANTQVAPDAAICAECAEEITSPFGRRYRYPFTNCTNCGPRLSIVNAIPYDRATTTMAPFVMCAACRAEYEDPADRRFHAEAIACHACGPKAKLVRFDGHAFTFDQFSMMDDVDAACGLIKHGEIVAIKGLGGYQLACDATKTDVVARLRRTKHRDAKPFALMARDLEVIRRYCSVSAEEEALLTAPTAPIVLLEANGPERLPDTIAPGLATLGFMLPTTPMHLLMLRRMARPVVMTSGNLSDEPQVVLDAEAGERLGGIASYALIHDREIANRIDDSVVRVVGGRVRLLRRARGYAPEWIVLPRGFEAAPDVLAMGGELKSTFCLLNNGAAILSQHQGDLEDARCFDDYRKNLVLYARLFDHAPAALAVDLHPEYLSSKFAHERAVADRLPLVEVQHHHAHVASCLAENNYPLDAPAVLGIVLDGLGWGGDGTLWGGEFLLADYRRYQRLGTFKPVAMVGGATAAREPWRNLYAHLMAEMKWPEFSMNFDQLALHGYLSGKPRGTLDAMIKKGINALPASSCGRLFDAFAAALDVCRERQAYEGEAAARLEAMVDPDTMLNEGDELGYPLTIPNLPGSGLPYIEPRAMWAAVLGDLILNTPAPVMAARFHKGLAISIVAMTRKLAGGEDDATQPRFSTVALSGGCFQNRVLFQEVSRRLGQAKFSVLSHAQVPANDGGLALGQAAIAAAHLIDKQRPSTEGSRSCVSAFPDAS
ncbi:carbamoyltransferase HypF [Bradyrhizobium canariense]|uniref:carbamoyltransferase HypF n=1 Tax=Bradyrhizobium canariense TaxID=255045 RepID=UPI001CA5A882|nr:carbamoyltransferase HypF [Bradyrhizobium canariense]MBW5433709.1 carbamoyltransferase HypF [Bradyrhizobium canariense]